MGSSGHRRVQLDTCLVVDSSVAELQPGEAVPLLKHSSMPLSRHSFEMAPVHLSTSKSHFQTPTKANVIKTLQTFWKKKRFCNNSGFLSFADEALICCTVDPRTEPPYTCYVTLPNGCCFGNLLSECSDRAEACRSAAHIALVNSLYNELPCRKISDCLIETVIREATIANNILHGSSCSLEGIKVFRTILESLRGQTMLDYTAFVNQLLIMHWNGTLETLSQCGASRQQVFDLASSQQWFSEDCRSEMALAWIAIERQDPGSIKAGLKTAVSELEAAQRCGRELAFPRLKRDVLQLAANTVS